LRAAASRREAIKASDTVTAKPLAKSFTLPSGKRIQATGEKGEMKQYTAMSASPATTEVM